MFFKNKLLQLGYDSNMPSRMNLNRRLCEPYGWLNGRGVSHNLPDWRGISVQLYHAVITFAWIYRTAMYLRRF